MVDSSELTSPAFPSPTVLPLDIEDADETIRAVRRNVKGSREASHGLFRSRWLLVKMPLVRKNHYLSPCSYRPLNRFGRRLRADAYSASDDGLLFRRERLDTRVRILTHDVIPCALCDDATFK